MRTAWIVALALLTGGCVDRELTITSQPQGAIVQLSQVEIGRTPVTHSFTHYGDYDIIVSMDGYQTAKTHANLRPVWYQYLGVDLIAEILPWTFHDRRYVDVPLAKLELPSDEELVNRALEMQRKNAEPVGH